VSGRCPFPAPPLAPPAAHPCEPPGKRITVAAGGNPAAAILVPGGGTRTPTGLAAQRISSAEDIYEHRPVTPCVSPRCSGGFARLPPSVSGWCPVLTPNSQGLLGSRVALNAYSTPPLEGGRECTLQS
jgi:hypothetical protein